MKAMQTTTANKRSLKGMGLFPKLGVSLMLLIVFALLAGGLYQRAATARDRATYLSSRNLIEVDGVEMHIRCAGEGSPTVLFESGAGAASLNWWEVQAAVVQDTRTCVYDRQGIGWSEYTGRVSTSDFVAQTLHTLLQKAGESGPYLLVGHSLGGVYVREYAAQYPEEVVGMVLIDSAHQQQMARFPADYAVLADSELPTLRLCRWLAPTGLLRLLDFSSQNTVYADTPVYHEDSAIFYQSTFCAGVSADLAAGAALDTTIAPATLGDLPLAVLTAGVPISARPEALPMEFSPETLHEVDRVWLELQEELAALSTNSSWTVVEDATHFIHHDQPQIVIDAIRHILGQVAAG